MSDLMLHGVLNMPLPDDPSELDLVTWVQFRDRAREASARIEELEAEQEALIVARDMMGRKWATAREDALREAAETAINWTECYYTIQLDEANELIYEPILTLINKEPNP